MLSTATELLSWQFENGELADPDLVDNLVLSLCDNAGIPYPNFKLHLLLSEVITNAIDHGVLKLDSRLKEGNSGFAIYLKERAQRFASIADSWVSISAEWVSAGVIRISVTDSGEGFDYQSVVASDPGDDRLHGRGLAIIESLCKSMTHIDRGNCIVIEFDTEGP